MAAGAAISGCGSPRSWVTYGRALRDWLEFVADRGAGVFDTRERLRELLGAYAAYRACGPAESRFGASTWAQHVSILSGFYRWAVAEGYAGRGAVHLPAGPGASTAGSGW